MKIIIIGGVAAGTSVATKARRNNEEAQITLYERDVDISYSGCGLPYFIGDDVKNIEELRPRDPKFFKDNHNIDILIRHEVISINHDDKKVMVRNLETKDEFEDDYDILVIATGASSFVPPIAGVDLKHVFSLRSVQDALAIKNYINEHNSKSVVIVGSGFIGLELLESFSKLGLEVSMVELADQIAPNLDQDMANLLETKLLEKNISILKGVSANEVKENSVVLSDGQELQADVVVFATGVRPNTKLAESIGCELGVTKAIKVNKKMETSVKDVYAVGDCIETFNRLTSEPAYVPLGTTANKTGRICGDVITGGEIEFQGILGTGIFKVFEYSVGSSGLTEKQALDLGYDIEVIHNTKSDRSTYLGGQRMVIKAIADKKTKTVIGVQIVGVDGVDKRLDVLSTLMTYKVPVEEYFHLDLAYAPPFSTVKDPVHYTGMILSNIFESKRIMIQSNQLQSLENVLIIDARTQEDVNKKGLLPNAIHVPLKDLRNYCEKLDHDQITITYCNSGTTSNSAQNILINKGIKTVYNLSGGQDFYKGSQKNND